MPASGKFIYESPKSRLSVIDIRGGVPTEDRQVIDYQIDTTEEVVELDQVVLAIALTTSPSYGLNIGVWAPDEFTLRITERVNEIILVTRFDPPSAIYGVNFGDHIVLNYSSYQYEMPNLVINGPFDKIVTPDPDLTLAIICDSADFTPLPNPQSWSGSGINSRFLSSIGRLTPGDHWVSYKAYINLNLIDENGNDAHLEYLILEKVFNFTI